MNQPDMIHIPSELAHESKPPVGDLLLSKLKQWELHLKSNIKFRYRDPKRVNEAYSRLADEGFGVINAPEVWRNIR